MCLKVSTKRELGEAGPRAAELAVTGELPRVQVQALRTLGAVGDTEHVDVVRGLLDDEEQAVRRQAARSLEQLARRLDLDETSSTSSRTCGVRQALHGAGGTTSSRALERHRHSTVIGARLVGGRHRWCRVGTHASPPCASTQASAAGRRAAALAASARRRGRTPG